MNLETLPIFRFRFFLHLPTISLKSFNMTHMIGELGRIHKQVRVFSLVRLTTLKLTPAY